MRLFTLLHNRVFHTPKLKKPLCFKGRSAYNTVIVDDTMLLIDREESAFNSHNSLQSSNLYFQSLIVNTLLVIMPDPQ
jgi:hypothetical protein